MGRHIRLMLVVVVVIVAGYLGSQRGSSWTRTNVPRMAAGRMTLAEARRAHPTHLVRHLTDDRPVDPPPAGVFDLVHYPAAPGPLAAYMTPDPRDGHRHPAIVWVTGGNSNTIDHDCWAATDPDDNQSADAYRKAGIGMMFVSLRGGNTNPGGKEKYFGEVDDVCAAEAYLAKQPWVDPARIYLGGHSAGGTVALLAAETTDAFRAVFCFGPSGTVAGPTDFQNQPWPFDTTDPAEFRLRSPASWLSCVRSPTFVLEGADRGNAAALKWMRDHARDMPALHWALVPGKTHFSVLGPANAVIAKKILADTGATTAIELTSVDVATMAAH